MDKLLLLRASGDPAPRNCTKAAFAGVLEGRNSKPK